MGFSSWGAPKTALGTNKNLQCTGNPFGPAVSKLYWYTKTDRQTFCHYDFLISFYKLKLNSLLVLIRLILYIRGQFKVTLSWQNPIDTYVYYNSASIILFYLQYGSFRNDNKQFSDRFSLWRVNLLRGQKQLVLIHLSRTILTNLVIDGHFIL